MKKYIIDFLQNESGAEVIEYIGVIAAAAVIIAAIGVVVKKISGSTKRLASDI